MRTVVLATLGGVLALAGCGPAGDAEKGDSAATVTEAIGDGPKPGLWRATMAMDGMPEGMVPTFTICTTERKFEPPEGAGPTEGPADIQCSQLAFRREGEGFTGSSTCTLPKGVTMKQTTRVSGDYESRYVMESTTTTELDPTGQGARTTTMTFERLGECPPGTPEGIVKAN